MAAACQSAGGADLPGLPPGTSHTTDRSSTAPVRSADAGAGELRITIATPVPTAALKGGTAPEVRARILSLKPGTEEPAMDPVDPTSVAFTLGGAGDSEPAATGRLFGPLPGGEFAGRLDLGRIPTGDYTLTITAATQGGTSGAASVLVRVDAGPRITIVSPREHGSYKGSVLVQVIIDSA